MKNNTRRDFLATLGTSSLILAPGLSPINPKYPIADDNINHLGPKEGFSPLIGSLISMLDWVSNTVTTYNSKLSIQELDYLHDENSNTIGSLMMHVAATEVIYQDITFSKLEDFTAENKAKWGVAMDLGEEARLKIKGNPLSYYKDAIDEVRAKTKAEMKKLDDKWLLEIPKKDWDWNHFCMWFHVTEHYANHRGQMTWYAKRAK